jgi:TM2 domain-containing membrane protein YozV
MVNARLRVFRDSLTMSRPIGGFHMSDGQGSSGNVLAAICSFFIPGLGQLVQGRVFKALIMFVLAAVLWVIWMGWIIHLWSIVDAALYRRRD